LLAHVVAEMRRIFNIDNGIEVVLESRYALTGAETLNNLDVTLDEAGIGYGHRFVIREKPANSSESRQPRQDLVMSQLTIIVTIVTVLSHMISMTIDFELCLILFTFHQL